MGKLFGKRRVPNCKCDYNYTCGPCLRDAVGWWGSSMIDPREPATTEANIMKHMAEHHAPYVDEGRVVSPERYALMVHETDHEDYQGHAHD